MFCDSFALHLVDRNAAGFLPMDFGISWQKIAGDGKAYESHDWNKKKEPDFGLS